MDTENSQAETQTPKYKVGDVVWIVDRAISGGSALILNTKIAAVAYKVNRSGEIVFYGYQTFFDANICKTSRPESVYATKAEAVAHCVEIFETMRRAKNEQD